MATVSLPLYIVLGGREVSVQNAGWVVPPSKSDSKFLVAQSSWVLTSNSGASVGPRDLSRILGCLAWFLRHRSCSALAAGAELWRALGVDNLPGSLSSGLPW